MPLYEQAQTGAWTMHMYNITTQGITLRWRASDFELIINVLQPTSPMMNGNQIWYSLATDVPSQDVLKQ